MFNEYLAITIIISTLLLVSLPVIMATLIIKRHKRILKNGIKAQARVISCKPSMLKMGKHAGSKFMQGAYFELEIFSANENENYKANSRSVIHVSDFSRMVPGTIVNVRIDQKNHQKVLLENEQANVKP